ncbi:MAG TPA: nucleoside-diphosphate sugar epimerase/dehydratase [Sulfuricurvum sp.]|nr:MAG: UDP-N-acetylglucosamine 4,6-dehydratase [Campylobacterales bacterium 16-40-21]OZA02286.1 MAG: UDP-N-acetylglucosamine 4,6-dehydratase [Sulfuricurvum sp. 17-40-25]HQS67307.1 nucleoside-diphosphate sugar epimerase/dehydratase [Sulfuricurvum sp.]HQT36673.1 nucleoside-diphosphate sugar epimerase/dehydratase [Sulfuricurvum sp.]
MASIDKNSKLTLFLPSSSKRITFFLITDIFLSVMSLYGAYLLRFNFLIPSTFLTHFLQIAIVLITIKVLFLFLFKNYSIIWRFYGLNDAKKLVLAHLAAYFVFSLIIILLPDLFSPFPRSVVLIDMALSIILLGELRFTKRLILDRTSQRIQYKQTLIIGISSNTANLIKSTLESVIEYTPVGIIAIQNKNSNMIGSYISNLKVSRPQEIPDLIKSKNITAAIIDGSLPRDQLRETYKFLTNLGIQDIKRSSLLTEGSGNITSLSIEDLLARHPKDLDTQTIEEFIKGKKVLITGAGGSIGSEISLQCAHFGAQRLILIDHSEYNLYQIGEKLPNATLRLCNILDRIALDSIIELEKPDIVIHAAAYKHVPLCEANIQSAIMNNVQGSRNVIDSAIAHDVPKIVIISTDKAVRPTNVMGTTKRIVELYAQNVDPKNSEIAAVRFGNVLGSSGSVIPKFKAQLESGGPITLTHPDITRYFMLISEACQLVLQAAAIAKGKELFILDMGEPVKIIDLARTMIKLYATNDVEIVMTGLRPGEKLYEELLIDDSEQKTSYTSIMIAGSTHYPIEQLNHDIKSLLTTHEPISLLKKIVPEFTPDVSNA